MFREQPSFGKRVCSTLCFTAQLQFAIQFLAFECGPALAESSVSLVSSSCYLLEESKLRLTFRKGCGACQKANRNIAMNAASCSRPQQSQQGQPIPAISGPSLDSQNPQQKKAYTGDISLSMDQQPE